MKITVCELPNDFAVFESAWNQLVAHVSRQKSELVLLPEMPFSPWLAQDKEFDLRRWEGAVENHERWISRLRELSPATVVSTRPTIDGDTRSNLGYFWEAGVGIQDVHAKYYLPDEEAFWEASWYQRGDGSFSTVDTPKGKIGFLICTELWFNQHARRYGKQGVHFIVCPRATPKPTADKWVVGGQTAAVVSGAYCLSSNLSGTTPEGGDFAGVGWIIEPEEGKILGLTSAEEPFLTLDVDLARAEKAKSTYPRYVLD
ncbi:MAG: carbon-nitrogen hydrolase family protein [Anaerolineales bacterium]